MYIRDKNTQSPIQSFQANKLYGGMQWYRHVIYCADDDRVECLDNKGEVVLIHTANSDVLDKDKKQIGRWTMRDLGWVFQQEGKPDRYFRGGDLLKAEVEISRLYIAGEL